MKAAFRLPSGNYNITISKEEFNQLLEKGNISARVSKMICTTGRGVINKNGDGLETLDKKEIHNDLRFFLSEPVADLNGGDWCVQFINISVEKEQITKSSDEVLCFDCTLKRQIHTPDRMLNFLNEIEAVCTRYNLSISHEDTHGNFLIEDGDHGNIKWLKSANKNYYDMGE